MCGAPVGLMPERMRGVGMAENERAPFAGGARCVKHATLALAALPCHNPGDPMFRLRVFILFLLIAAGAASGMEIREKRWGFDGRVRVGRFNVLSLLVSNPDARGL